MNVINIKEILRVNAMKRGDLKICIICSGEFIQDKLRKYTCSSRCAREKNKIQRLELQRVITNCIYCSNKLGNNIVKYCNDICKERDRYIRHRFHLYKKKLSSDDLKMLNSADMKRQIYEDKIERLRRRL